MTWLSSRSKDILEFWFRNTDSPMIVSQLDGTILDANRAFCKVMGYTHDELVGELDDQGQRIGGKTWIELSVSDTDLVADQQAAKTLSEGTETQYWVRKHYIPKGKAPEPVLLHVMRYPLVGRIECYLVSAHFLSAEADIALEAKLDGMEERLQQCMIQMMAREMDDAERIALSLCRIVKQYPRRSVIAILVMVSLLVGDRVVQVLQSILSLGL